MAGLSQFCPKCTLLLLALLFPLELPLGEGKAAPSPEGAVSGVPSLPLIQMLLREAPPRARPQGRRRRQTRGQPLRYMLDLYRSVADRHGQPRRNRRLSTNAIRLVQPFAKARQPGTGPWLVWNLDYRLEIKPQVEHLVRATVVYSRIQSSSHGQFLCSAELLSSGSVASPVTLGLAPPRTDIRNASTASSWESWVETDLSAHLQLWAWGAHRSRVVRVSHTCAFLGPFGGSSPDPGWADKLSLNYPFLLLYLNDTQRGIRAEFGGLSSEQAPFPQSLAHVRQAREVGKLALDVPSYGCTKSPKQKECSLRHFRVSFRQLGWDHWIIAPNWYLPQYCKGSCPRILRYGFNSPNHAIIQNFINELVDQSVPRPSCVPYEYGPISVLMLEQNNNVLYKVYEDMVAKSCTCR
ncbi:bone morphogenetic protein 15 [Elgaria multicarinata webbii]|uniref:bone morphogenetic protein 15 n=1 Tax=Elgaria multicarinata webbii TaxID=159646 RepID=UPI002FCD3C47